LFRRDEYRWRGWAVQSRSMDIGYNRDNPARLVRQLRAGFIADPHKPADGRTVRPPSGGQRLIDDCHRHVDRTIALREVPSSPYRDAQSPEIFRTYNLELGSVL